MKHTAVLNEKQREAVLHMEGPLLVVAGAGAGKTRVIAHRIMNLITRGVAPEEILAITFTNKAAGEMRGRILTLLAEAGLSSRNPSQTPFISTFHALGVHILREEGKHIGIRRHFTVVDQDDMYAFIRKAVREAGVDPKQFDPKRIAHSISRFKGDLVSRQAYARDAQGHYFPEIVARIWERYERMLAEANALDFDDLVSRTVELLREHADIQGHYNKHWRYLHVDEYQDTNVSQYELTRLLAQNHGNVCVVGDADQNIYGWRGATIRNILNFERDYPGARVILLEENYRSTQTILDAANAVIARNTLRVEKNLFTRKGYGEKISLFVAAHEREEAAFIAGTTESLLADGNRSGSIAVLYRANFQSRVLEEAFLARGIPYQVLGVRFFERKEVKDVVSFIRAAHNPESFLDIARIINVPSRGIGKVTLAKILAGKRRELPQGMRERVDAFYKILSRVNAARKRRKPSELVRDVLKETGMTDMFAHGGEEGIERLENIRELVTFASRYDGFSPEEGSEKMLADIALQSDQDSLAQGGDAVKLMTVHAAKGLEFPFVFIAGLEQDLFPHRNISEGMSDLERLEEERRLFYVALTRAEKKLYLSYAEMRTVFGNLQVNTPSEFLADIDLSLITSERAETLPTIHVF